MQTGSRVAPGPARPSGGSPGEADRRAGGLRVVLVRHGESTFNAQRRYQGRHDESVLTERGRGMARQVGRALAAYRFDRILASPLRRAHETARIIAQALGASSPVALEPALAEVDIPEWEARAHDEVRRSEPARHRHWLEHPESFRMRRRGAADPGDQFLPLGELHAAAAGLWRTLLRGPGRTVLLVSHGGTIRALLNTAIGAPVARHHVAGKTNCAITELVFPAAGPPRLLRVNDTTAIGQPIPAWKGDGTRLLLWPSGGPAGALLPPVGADEAPAFWIGEGPPGHRSPATEVCETRDPRQLLAALEGRLDAAPGPGRRTGVAVAPAASLQPLLLRLFALPGASGGEPWLRPGRLSVIDRYDDHPHPLLRALNLTPAGAANGTTEAVQPSARR